MRISALFVAAIAAMVIFGVSSNKAYAQTNKNINNNKNVAVVTTDKVVIVQPGQYLEEIATLNKTTYQRIFDANSQIVNPNLIYPGESLQIPAANQQLANRPLPVSSDQVSSTAMPEANTTTVAGNANIANPNQAVSSNSSDSNANGNLDIWAELANCESGGDWSINTGNGFYGGLQFTLSSWQAVGGVGYPNQASEAEQILLAEKLQAIQGWSAWPVCSLKLGL